MFSAPFWLLIVAAIKIYCQPGKVTFDKLCLCRVIVTWCALLMIRTFRSMREDAKRRSGAVKAIRASPAMAGLRKTLAKRNPATDEPAERRHAQWSDRGRSSLFLYETGTRNSVLHR
jgi:hypothetical protein